MSIARPVHPVRETHYRQLQLIIQHGTDAEKQEALDTLGLMKQMKLDHPEGSWEPMEAVVLPTVLVTRAEKLARWRQAEAKRVGARDKHGIRRTLEEEIRTVEGQYAAALILGLPFGDRLTWNTARKNGNLGQNCSAFTPRLGNRSLLIQEKEKKGRWMFLMHWDSGHRYECKGWCRAGAFMRTEFERLLQRHDEHEQLHVAKVWLVPPESGLLTPLREWWA